MSATDFNLPIGLAFDSQSMLYVANNGNGTILKVDPNNNTRSVFFSNTDPTGISGDFTKPLYLAFNKFDPKDTNLYATCQNNNFVYIFDNTGKLVTKIFMGETFIATGLAFDKNSNLYVANFNGATISKVVYSQQTNDYIVSPFVTGGLSGAQNSLTSLVYDEINDCLYVANSNTGKVYKINIDLSFVGQYVSLFGSVQCRGLALHTNNELYISGEGFNSNNYGNLYKCDANLSITNILSDISTISIDNGLQGLAINDYMLYISTTNTILRVSLVNPNNTVNLGTTNNKKLYLEILSNVIKIISSTLKN
jgi:DNA-binding beta-propeller fold protein YncE